MHTGLLHLHNLLRYAVVILLIIAVVRAFIAWFDKKPYTNSDNKISLFLLISAHLQLVIGLALYFISPMMSGYFENDMGEIMRSPVMRFWTVEHSLSMLIGIGIITLGRIMSKKGSNDNSKHRRSAIYFALAMVLIFSAIPWPFSEISRAWF